MQRVSWTMRAFLGAMVAVALACSRPDSSQTEVLRKEVADLRREMNHFKKVSADFDTEFLTRDILLGNIMFYETHAVIDCSGRGFVPVREGGFNARARGYFLVACDDATSYLNGHRLTLRVGNPQAVNYNGITLTVSWGRKLPEKLWEVGWHEQELSGLNTQRFQFPTSIPPGSWATLHVVLAPSTPEDLAVVVISVESNSVRLAG